MSDPICCPVCGNRELQTILRKAVSAGASDDESLVIEGVLAYRCSNGHLFTTFFNSDEANDQGLQDN